MSEYSTTQSAAPSAESIKKDDDEHRAAVVLSSVDDRFVLTQDMCVSCGSFGQQSENSLITCTQCGQCYHPFCAQVMVSPYSKALHLQFPFPSL